MARYTALDVAVHMINDSVEAGKPISNLQLQKILYFCQVGYLRNQGDFLFDDDFEAWRYGPVVPSIYRLFSIWGGSCISRTIKRDTKPLDSDSCRVIDPLISEYRDYQPWDLVSKAHKPGSPWKITWDELGDGAIITKELIRTNG